MGDLLNMENENKLKIAVLEEKHNNLEGKVDKILDNHLPHIQDKLDSVENKQNYWGGAIAILTILLPIIYNYLLK